MEFRGAGQFPSLTPRISELYGASGGVFRVGEADAYAQDLDELEREERALENMVQALVNRPAAVPIGVKFHREGAGAMLQQPVATGADSSRAGEVAVDPDMRFMQANSSEEEEVEDEDEEDLDEDEMMMDEDDEEEETTGRATIVRGEGPPQRYDSFEREESDEEPMDVEPQFDEELPPPSDWQ